jgi:hypothetical protein
MKLRDIRRRAKTPFTPVGDGLVFLRGYKAERCRTYAAGCPICDEWKFYDTYGRFTYTFEELRSYMNETEDDRVEKYLEANDEQKKMD